MRNYFTLCCADTHRHTQRQTHTTYFHIIFFQAFAVTKSSSAYWEGKADAECLQRIYAISFPKKDQLKVRVVLLAVWFTQTRTHTQTHKHTHPPPHTQTYKHTNTHTHHHTHRHTHTHTQTHTYTDTDTHAHTHTTTTTRSRSGST